MSQLVLDPHMCTMVSPYRDIIGMSRYIQIVIWLIVSLFPRLCQEYVLQRPRFASASCADAGSYHLSHPSTSDGETNMNIGSSLSLTVANSAGMHRAEVPPTCIPRHNPRRRMLSDPTTLVLLRSTLMTSSCAFPSLRTPPTPLRYNRSPSTPGAQATEIPSCHPSRSPFPRRQMTIILTS